MADASRPRTAAPPRIPFYRNVKTLGVLAQIVFAAVLVAGAALIYRNVTTALQASSIPANFSFLDKRAGIPIAESPIPYSPENSYGRAFLIGVLNTLKVALVGVLAASLLGVLVGVLRLSRNFVLRQLATLYVETLRNTPLAVQIVFWYTAILTPLPRRVLNATRLPGGVYLSNQGIGLPWAYPTPYMGTYWPLALLAVAVGLAVWWLRRRQLRRIDRPGNAAAPAWLALIVVGVAAYLALGRAPIAPDAAASFRAESGVITAFHDGNADGELSAGERILRFVPLEARVGTGQLRAQTQDLVESRRVVHSTFRFPPFRKGEYDAVEVTFEDAEAAASRGLRIDYRSFPNRGVVYVDRNGNGAYDRGEELSAETSDASGFDATLVMTVHGFHRRLVTDRDGRTRIPRFLPEGGAASASQGTNVSPAQLFSAPKASAAADQVQADVTLRRYRPLVWSPPSIPISTYVGGIELTTNYLALLLALIFYTASFIAEIVRGGLQAVDRGQREAAKALGLSDGQTFRLVVFPQALRIILPPMISQYLNLTKNSSLAPLAAYAELFAISIIIANQTGASVPVTVMVIAGYLLISLAFAFVLNIVNARMALVER